MRREKQFLYNQKYCCRISSFQFAKVSHCCLANLIIFSVKVNVIPFNSVNYVSEGHRSVKHSKNKKPCTCYTYLITEQIHCCCWSLKDHGGGFACFSSLTTNLVYLCGGVHFAKAYRMF